MRIRAHRQRACTRGNGHGRPDKSRPGPFDIRPLGFRPLIRAAPGDRSRGRGGRVLADPLVLPRVVVLLLVAARPVDGDQLAGDLLAMGARPARHLVDADVDLPLGPGPADPARGLRVLEREPLGRQVVGVAHVDHRVVLGLGLGLRLVHDRVHRRRLRRRPAAEQPRALERIASERAESDHRSSLASSASLTASVATIGAAGSPAVLAAARKTSVAAAIASSRPSATTISRAPYRLVPMPEATPSLAATASASSTISSRPKTRLPPGSTPTLHLPRCSM